RQADELADPASAVRRGVRLGDPEPRPAGAGRRHRHAGVRGEWRQRSDDPAALLAPARRPAAARAAEALSGLGTRVPVPASHRVRRRRRRVPRLSTKEKRMATIHLTTTTTATPEQYIDALTDFGPGRKELFGNSDDAALQLHSESAHHADVTE